MFWQKKFGVALLASKARPPGLSTNQTAKSDNAMLKWATHREKKSYNALTATRLE